MPGIPDPVNEMDLEAIIAHSTGYGLPVILSTSQVYLVEEDQANRRARKKAGGNSGKRYTEGWIEFEDKKIARGGHSMVYPIVYIRLQ